MKEDENGLTIDFEDKKKINQNIGFIEDGIKQGRAEREKEILELIDKIYKQKERAYNKEYFIDIAITLNEIKQKIKKRKIK